MLTIDQIRQALAKPTQHLSEEFLTHLQKHGHAEGGSIGPSIDEMRAHLVLHKADGGAIDIKDVGAEEAPNMDTKKFLSPGMDKISLPVGGVDFQPQMPGKQMLPGQPPGMPGQPPAPGQPPQGAMPPGTPPMGAMPPGMPGAPPAPPKGPPSNILAMTPQGQAMQAMRPSPITQPRPPALPMGRPPMARMAKGGSTTPSVQEMRKALDKFLGGSKVKERMYHGTGNLEGLTSFNPDMTGKGTDQLGSGFYFTTHPDEASGYATSVTPNVSEGTKKLGGDSSPGVVAAHLAIKKPIKIGPKGNNLNDARINLSHSQVKQIIGQAPNILDRDKSPLKNHVDTSRGVTPQMINDISKLYTGNQLHALGNDIFQKNPTAYCHALHKVTGYDGVMKDFGDGRKHYVAWFPEQVKSAIGNRGTYDKSNPDITMKRGGSTRDIHLEERML